MKVSEKHQTPAGQEVPVDESRVALETGHPDPLEATQDNLGILDHTQGVPQPELGGEDERDVKTKTKLTLGRHITSDAGLKVAQSRYAHVRGNRKETKKLFAKTEDGAKRHQ